MSMLLGLSKCLASSAKSTAVPQRTFIRAFVKVGDKVPVTYVKDEAVPVIKDNSEYPEWLFTVGAKEPSLGELVERAETVGINEQTFTVQEAKRLKRLLTLEEIKNANASKNSDSA